MGDPYGYDGNQPIVVDVQSLDDFHRAVLAEVTSFEEKIKPALAALAMGVPFGTAAGLREMSVARPKYQEVLEQGRKTLTALHAGTDQFQDAARKIAEKYQGADAFAAARPADVVAGLAPQTAPADGTGA